jgi:hypothetical protein
MTQYVRREETGSEPGQRRGLNLRAVCFGCGLERSDDPLVDGKGLSLCLACGETRVVIDERPDREGQHWDV